MAVSKDGLGADKEKIIKKYRPLWKKIHKDFAKALKEDDEEKQKSLKLSSDILNNIMKGEKLAWNVDGSAEGITIDELFGFAKRMEQTYLNK